MGDSMKKYVIFVIAILAVVVFSSGCTSDSQNKTYNASGIYFNYPASWQEGDPSQLLKGEIVYVIDPNSTNSDKATTDTEATTYAVITSKSLPSGSNLTNYYNQLVKQGQNYKNYKLVSNKELSLDGQTAYEIVFTSDLENNQKSTTQEEIIERNGKIYTIECVSTNDTEQNTANFDLIINSFKVQ